MTAKFINNTDQNSQAIGQCPIANQQIATGPSKQISFPGGQATWWQCPACQGWHIVTLNEKDTSGSIHSSTTS